MRGVGSWWRRLWPGEEESDLRGISEREVCVFISVLILLGIFTGLTVRVWSITFYSLYQTLSLSDED